MKKILLAACAVSALTAASVNPARAGKVIGFQPSVSGYCTLVTILYPSGSTINYWISYNYLYGRAVYYNLGGASTNPIVATMQASQALSDQYWPFKQAYDSYQLNPSGALDLTVYRTGSDRSGAVNCGVDNVIDAFY